MMNIVHISDGSEALLRHMAEIAEILDKAPYGEICRTKTDKTGWTRRRGDQIAVEPIRNDDDFVKISVGSIYDPITLTIDKALTPWIDERPTLEQIATLTRELAAGRMRNDDDPIEQIVQAVAVHLSAEEHTQPAQVPTSIQPAKPYVSIRGPHTNSASITFGWQHPLGHYPDDRYEPSAQLLTALKSIPEEIGIVRNKQAFTCSIRTARSAVSRLDPLQSLRILAMLKSSNDLRMVRKEA